MGGGKDLGGVYLRKFVKVIKSLNLKLVQCVHIAVFTFISRLNPQHPKANLTFP